MFVADIIAAHAKLDLKSKESYSAEPVVHGGYDELAEHVNFNRIPVCKLNISVCCVLRITQSHTTEIGTQF